MDASYLDHCPGILVVADLAGVVLDANREAERALGQSSVRGKPLREMVHPEDKAAFVARWVELQGGASAVRAVSRFQMADSTERLAWTAQRAPDRDAVYATLVALPEEERPPTRLDDSARLLKEMLDHMDISATILDLDGRVVFHDGKQITTSGLIRGQLLHLNLFELYESVAPDSIRNVRKTMASGEPSRWTAEIHDMLWDTSCFPLRDEDGRVVGAVLGTLDKSDVKRAMSELQAKLHVIERQQEVIRDLETPIIQVWERVLTLPMVGVVDTQRAARVMNDLLAMVVDKGARYAILDLTGVDTVDTATARHLLDMIDAVRLLGAEGVISGIRPTVAQTIVTLGVNLSTTKTCGNLQEALRYCIHRMTAEAKMARIV